MGIRFQSSAVFKELRQRAERTMQQKEDRRRDVDDLDLVRLAHELEVQYVELELQNEELRRTAKELEASRDAFVDLYDTAPVAFVSLNREGRIEQINQTAAQMLADPEEFLTGTVFLHLIHPEDRERFHRRVQQKAQHGGDAPLDLRLKGRGGDYLDAQVHVTGKRNEAGTYWRLALVDVTARRQYENALEESRRELEDRVAERTAELTRRTQQLARLTSELALAEQRERRRLSELLHDHLQQLLAGARINLDLLGETRAIEADPAFREVHNLLLGAIQTSRSLSSELSPPVLYLQGLSGALAWLARWMEQTHKLKVEVAADPAADPAREDLKILLFQAVRELLFNVVKHAGTQAAWIEMTRHDHHTRIVVRDRGAGFDAETFWDSKPEVEGGYGLFSIRERMAFLGGTFDLVSRPSHGTTATLSLPLVARAPEPASETESTKPPGGHAEGASKIRILLVDDHAMVRKGFSLLLSRHADIEIAGEAEDGRKAVEAARKVKPDVILMDINMPVMNGLEATRRIHEELPRVRIIGLSMHLAEDQAQAIFDAGAEAYLNKSANPDSLLQAIRSR